MKRAIRRHHRARLKETRVRYHSHNHVRQAPEIAARYVDTPCPCSCWMCGNPRRSWAGPRLTMQERRFSCPLDDNS